MGKAIASSVVGYEIMDKGYSSPCWIWTGRLNKRGYGRILIGNGLEVVAHRMMYNKHKGNIPKGYLVHHLCEVPACVNPDHLVAVSRSKHTRCHYDIRRLLLQKMKNEGER